MVLVIVIIVILLLMYELVLCGQRTYKKRSLYKKALMRSHQTGKPLLVIGNPIGGATDRLIGESHGKGDICVDITGCGEGSGNYKMKAHELLMNIPSDSCIIYSSMVLEYIEPDEIDKTIRQIKRVAGNKDNIFLIFIQQHSLNPYYYGGTQRVFHDTIEKYTPKNNVITLMGNTK